MSPGGHTPLIGREFVRARVAGMIEAPGHWGGRRTRISAQGAIRRSASVHSFQLEGGLLLFDERSSRLFAYNETAQHAWDLIGSGRAEEDLILEFAVALPKHSVNINDLVNPL